MQPLIAIGFLAFLIVALVVGVRLLLLASRTRQLPELLIGIGVLGIGPIGFGFLVAGAAASGKSIATAAALATLGSLAVFIGVQSKWIFNWRVYHPRSRAVGTTVAIVAMVQIYIFFHRAFGEGFLPSAGVDNFVHAQAMIQIGCLLWGSAEALNFWVLMRRRVRLGLASAEVANRFFLWGLGAGAAGVGTAIGTVVTMMTGVPSIDIPWVVACSSAHGFVAAVAMWLAFLPPAAYRRWIQSTAPADDSLH